MASYDSFASLSRTSKRGVSPTSGSSHDGSMAAPLSIGAVDDPQSTESHSADLLVNTPNQPMTTLPDSQNPLSTGSFHGMSRAANEDAKPVQRSYTEAPDRSAFAGLTRENGMASRDSTPQRSARRDIHAIKVVTRLIQGISFNPGSKASNNVKSSTLRDQLVEVHRLAGDLAEAAAPEESSQSWVLAQCSEVVADLIARHSERFGAETADSAWPEFVNQQVQAVNQMLRSSETDAELARALTGLSQSQYVQATDTTIARDRLSVSVAAATWDLHEKVVESGFLFGLSSIEIVESLSAGLVKAASETNIQIPSLDMQTSHLQGSIRRLAGLIGAEYASRAKKLLHWINEGGQPDEKRAASANASYPGLLREIQSVARKNFYSIEKIAPKLIEETYQEHGSRSCLDRQN